jgi:Ca2+-binding RTX toxin-like protein
MSIAYDTQTQLDGLLVSGGIDLSVRNAIINYLMDDGLLMGPGSQVLVQDQNLPPPVFPPLDPPAQVLFLNNPIDTVSTDPNLQVIVEAGDAYLTVTGSNDVLVATGKGPDVVNMTGSSGDDVVNVGSGSQIVLAGQGADSVYGGKGPDEFIGGSGDRQLQQAGSGPATLIGGSGSLDTIVGGNGTPCDTMGSADVLYAGTGDQQWLLAGSGPETLYGGSGVNDTVTGGSGKDQIFGGSGAAQSLEGGSGSDTITAGTGGDVLRGGTGDDVFKIGLVGNDTVNGGGGHDTVDFSNHFLGGNATVTTVDGLTQVQFANTGQAIDVSNVKTLVFSDHTVNLH